jgi:hypothetical protein
MLRFPKEVKFTRDLFIDDKTNQKLLQRDVIDAMRHCGSFWISKRGVILYQPDSSLPDVLIGITRNAEVEAVLRDGRAVKLTGETLSDEEWLALCKAVFDHRFKFYSAAHRPAARTVRS